MYKRKKELQLECYIYVGEAHEHLVLHVYLQEILVQEIYYSSIPVDTVLQTPHENEI